MAEWNSSSNIFKNAKYADDAVFSVFSNLRKAAKRKNDHVWSANNFTFLDSVWDDEMKPKTSNLRDDVSKARNDQKREKGPLKNQSHYCNTNLRGESEVKNPENECRSYRVQNATSSIDSNNATVFNKNQEYRRNISTLNKLATIVSTNLKESNDIPIATSSNTKEEDCNVILSTVHESRVKKETLKKDSDDKCRIYDTTYEQNQLNSQMEKNLPGARNVKTQQLISEPLFGIDEKPPNFKTSVAKSTDVSLGAKNYTSNTKSTRDNQECPKIFSRGEINNIKLNQKANTVQRTKRTRHDSESSTKSSVHLTKKLSSESENRNIGHDSDKRNSILRTMLSVKIVKGDAFFDTAVKRSDFERIKRKFLKLEGIFPDIDGSKKKINYSVDATKAIFGFLFNPPFNFNELPEDRITLEIIAAAKAWEITHLHKRLQEAFLAKLNKNNLEIYALALNFGLDEICDAYENLFTDGESFTSDKPYKQKNCFLSVSTYIEPREFCIPLHIAAHTSLNDNFTRDINNEIVFEAIAGSYVIMGFHILLNVDEKEWYSKNLRVFYRAKNLNNSDEKEEMKVSKPLRSTIVIHFQKCITVNRYQKAEIAIDIAIEPCFCLATKESSIAGKCEEGDYSLDLTSTYKVAKSNVKRFFIGKLLYYPKSDTL